MLKTAVVTGASRGIGFEIAKTLAADGYQVACIARTESKAVRELKQNKNAVFSSADLTDTAKLTVLAQEILEQMGHVDALVHCAGAACHGLFQEISVSSRQNLYALNLTAPVELSRLLLPSMIRRHSSNILCVSSVWGEIGASCEVDYSVTKGALLAFVKALAKEVGLSGIRVNAVSPGTILTDMTKPLGEETLRDLADETALGRLGTPADVAGVVQFLLSGRAGYITGQNISVNGGFF